jgi:hypothetical protein
VLDRINVRCWEDADLRVHGVYFGNRSIYGKKPVTAAPAGFFFVPGWYKIARVCRMKN